MCVPPFDIPKLIVVSVFMFPIYFRFISILCVKGIIVIVLI